MLLGKSAACWACFARWVIGFAGGINSKKNGRQRNNKEHKVLPNTIKVSVVKIGEKVMKKKQRIERSMYFSLMEIIVAITILAIMGAIAIPAYYSFVKSSRITAAREQIRILESIIEDYRMDTAKLPASLNDLLVDPGVKNWDGPYLKRVKKVPKDPWGNDYILKIPGDNVDFEVISYGSDGQPGGSDDAEDINSMPEE